MAWYAVACCFACALKKAALAMLRARFTLTKRAKGVPPHRVHRSVSVGQHDAIPEQGCHWSIPQGRTVIGEVSKSVCGAEQAGRGGLPTFVSDPRGAPVVGRTPRHPIVGAEVGAKLT